MVHPYITEYSYITFNDNDNDIKLNVFNSCTIYEFVDVREANTLCFYKGIDFNSDQH